MVAAVVHTRGSFIHQYIAGLDIEAVVALVAPTSQRYAFDDLPDVANPA